MEEKENPTNSTEQTQNGYNSTNNNNSVNSSSSDSSKNSDSNKNSSSTQKRKSFNKRLRRILVFITLLVFGIYSAINYRANYLSYKGIDPAFETVFNEKMHNYYSMFGLIFVVLNIIIYLTNKFIFKGLKKFFKEENREMPKLPNKTICIIGSLIFSVIFTKALSDKFQIFKNAAVFGKGDPIFNIDISYYMFILPFVQTLLISLGALTLFLIAYIGIYYVVAFNVFFEEGIDVEKLKKNTFVKQEMFLVMVLVIILCGYIFFNAQNVFTETMVTLSDDNSTSIIGAGMTDVTIKVWGYRILSVVVLIAAIRLLRYVKKGNFKQSIISVAIVPAYLVCLFIAMIAFQMIYVGKNELDGEKTYIGYNIANTKEAYNIDIEQENIKEYAPLTAEEVDENDDVIDNIPLVSKSVTSTTIAEHQENSVYYSYDNTFLANYGAKGNGELVYITPREILTDNTVSYNNKTLRYTHGYSMVVNSASETDNKGYIKYILSDFENEEIMGIKEPRIYFGLDTNSTIRTNTSFGQEYDYPLTPTTNSENTYDGEAGLNLGFVDRFVIGMSEGNIRLALSRDNTADTKVINYRNVIERAKKAFPDVLYDEDPYIVINDEGRLVWVIDAYTRSGAYPYSQYSTINIKGYREKINYIRNSVKVLIDAYDGTTTFYITDKTDPIIMTYRNMYPELFTEEELPEDIKEHVIYPKFLYDVQAKMVNLYHDISEDTLYRGDDIWEITTKASSTNSTIAGVKMDSYYTMLKTIDNEDAKLGLLLTYNKLGKQNITSYLVGTIEDGKQVLSLYKFNQENNVVGIMQLNNQIEQDTTIAEELKAINTSGTKLIKDMLIVPINESLLYVEPVYQVMLNESEIPSLKKVIVASGNTVAIGDTLQIALTNLFSEAKSVDLEIYDTDSMNAIIDSVIKANKNLDDSLNSNNFEMIGKDITNLQSLINQLEISRKAEIEKEQEKAKELEREKEQEALFGENKTENGEVSTNGETTTDNNTNTNQNPSTNPLNMDGKTSFFNGFNKNKNQNANSQNAINTQTQSNIADTNANVQ